MYLSVQMPPSSRTCIATDLPRLLVTEGIGGYSKQVPHGLPTPAGLTNTPGFAGTAATRSSPAGAFQE